jgi:hypothetical protein
MRQFRDLFATAEALGPAWKNALCSRRSGQAGRLGEHELPFGRDVVVRVHPGDRVVGRGVHVAAPSPRSADGVEQ